MEINSRDFWRPFFGLIALQPLVLVWCYLFNLDYFQNLGIFSIICTLYLVPVYAWYERKCNDLEDANKQAKGWPI